MRLADTSLILSQRISEYCSRAPHLEEDLAITNVGLEAVADYTCVAVNAGGVMEEAITLTFEEPEPVCI